MFTDAASRVPAAVTAMAMPVAILIAALLLCWPAFYNGYPLVYGDSASYLDTIDPRKAFWPRPVFYTVFLRPLHWGVWLWPTIFVQSLIVAHLVYLVLRVIHPALRVGEYLFAVAVLAVATSLPWFTSMIMPDVLTPVVVLGMFLLGFGADRVRRLEAWYVGALTTGAIVCHLSHIGLAIGLVVVILLVRAAIGMSARRRAVFVAALAAPTVLATVAHLAVNGIAKGEITLSPASPIWLLARSIGDGPARAYLADACPQRGYILCAYVDELPADSDQFLWGDFTTDAVFYRAGGADALRAEARDIVRETLAAYPLWQFRAFVANATRQFFTFGTGSWLDFGPDKLDQAISRYIKGIFPRGYPDYIASAQINDRIPIEMLNAWHILVVLAGMGVSVFFVAEFAGRADRRPIAFFVVILAALVGNAIIAGGLSAVHDRYQSRLIWLLVFNAVAVALRYRAGRRSPALVRPQNAPTAGG